MSETRLGSRVIARLVGEDYGQLVRTLAPDDLWGQVRRHVLGHPVEERQIELIVAAIQDGLALRSSDTVLDLACGNGALSHRLMRHCAALHGVDVSDALVDVANTYFTSPPGVTFATADVADYVEHAPDPGRFTKALCYGSFHHLTRLSATLMLQKLARRFCNLQTVFIGNLPDLDRVHAFYPGSDPTDPDLSNPLTETGIWRTQAELVELARQTGWHAVITTMPPAFYAAHYRFDVTLTRPRGA